MNLLLVDFVTAFGKTYRPVATKALQLALTWYSRQEAELTSLQIDGQ